MTLQPLAVLIVGGLLGPRLALPRCSRISHLAPRVFRSSHRSARRRRPCVRPDGRLPAGLSDAAYAVGRLGRWAPLGRLAVAVLTGLALIHLGGLAQLLIITHSLQDAARLSAPGRSCWATWQMVVAGAILRPT